MPNYNLDDLLRAISVAVHEANRELTDCARQDFERHFQANYGALEPKTLPLVLPRDHLTEGEEPRGIHHVPQAALVHHRPLALDTLKLEFDCQIEGIVTGDKDRPLRVQVMLGPDAQSTTSAGRISLEFRSGDTPEGIARVNDKLLKSF